MKEIKKPFWCKREETGKHYSTEDQHCCHCGKSGIFYQQGDGKFIHSLCNECTKFFGVGFKKT